MTVLVLPWALSFPESGTRVIKSREGTWVSFLSSAIDLCSLLFFSSTCEGICFSEKDRRYGLWPPGIEIGVVDRLRCLGVDDSLTAGTIGSKFKWTLVRDVKKPLIWWSGAEHTRVRGSMVEASSVASTRPGAVYMCVCVGGKGCTCVCVCGGGGGVYN